MRNLAILLTSFLACPAWAQEDAGVVVPFDTIKSRHMIVDVVVNGKGPFTLIFDTGAPLTLIGPKLAMESKIPLTGGFAAFFGNFGQQKIATLEMGGIKLEKVDAMVMEHPIVAAIARATGKKIDGIIGFNVFGRYKTTIDYQAKTLTFVPSDFRPVNMMDALLKLMMPSANDLERGNVIAPQSLLGLRVGKDKDDRDAGVVVEAVFPGGPAAKAGIKPGDRLLTVDSRWTDQIADCYEALRVLKPGETARIEIRRDGKTRTLEAKVVAGF